MFSVSAAAISTTSSPTMDGPTLSHLWKVSFENHTCLSVQKTAKDLDCS